MLLMTERQDGKVIWVVVELHRPKGRIRSRIIRHLGEFFDRADAEKALLERLKVDADLRAHAELWAKEAEEILKDRKARLKFHLHGAPTGGLAPYADELLRRREQAEADARARARAALWSHDAPRGAFSLLGLPPVATIEQIKYAYRRRAMELHPDRGGNPAAMIRLNAAYEEAIAYAEWQEGE